jgi:hypothetical protein
MTAAEAIIKLEQFDPKGWMIIHDDGGRNSASIVTGLGYQNIETYGLTYDGIDYSEDKDNSDFVGLPYAMSGEIVEKVPGEYYDKAFIPTQRFQCNVKAITIGEAIKRLKSFKPNAELISFSWAEVVDIIPFDNKNKVLKFGWETSGVDSGGNCTEGLPEGMVAEVLVGKQYETGFDPIRIKRRENAGMTMDARKKLQNENYKVKDFKTFIKESKNDQTQINEGGMTMVQDGSEVSKVMSAIEKLVNQDITFDVIINAGKSDAQTITIHGINKKDK